MKGFILILFISIFNFNTYGQINGEDISLNTKTGTLSGTLLYPNVTKKIPVVLIIAGSGPTDRNGNSTMTTNNSLKMLAEGLYKNEIASVRFDKRGVAQSADAAINELNLRFENFIDDAKAWVNLLQKDSRFSEIIIAGHSQGSLIGIITAQKSEVSKFISLAGPGVPAGEVIKEQLNTQPASIKDKALPIIKKLENGKTVEKVPQNMFSLFRPSIQPYMISWFNYDPQKEIKNLNKPVLIIQGKNDLQVTVLDAQKLNEANKNAEIHIIEKMNHILKEAEADRMLNLATYANPDLPLADELIKIIVTFINK